MSSLAGVAVRVLKNDVVENYVHVSGWLLLVSNSDEKEEKIT